MNFNYKHPIPNYMEQQKENVFATLPLLLAAERKTQRRAINQFYTQFPLSLSTAASFYSCHFTLSLSTVATFHFYFPRMPLQKKNNNAGRMISISPLISVSSVFSIFALIYERKWCDTLIFSFISTFFPLGIATSLKLDYEHFHCIMIFHKLMMIYGDG